MSDKKRKKPEKQRIVALKEWSGAWRGRFGSIPEDVLSSFIGQQVTITNAPDPDSARPPTALDVWVTGYAIELVFPSAFEPGKEDSGMVQRLSIITVDGQAMWLSKGSTITYRKSSGKQKTVKVK